jgi:hypothetical protein
MKEHMVLALSFVLVVGCESSMNVGHGDEADATLATTDSAKVVENNRQAAEALYLYPSYKYVSERRYTFSSADRRRALDTYRDTGADTLYEIVIDRRGKVTRSRLLQTDVRKEYRRDVEAHARAFGFSEDSKTNLYRAFFFPVNYSYDADFEWADD